MGEIVREKTLIEELHELEVDEATKKRIINKAEQLIKNFEEERMYRSNSNRYNCLADTRIQVLEQTIANMCVKQFGKAEWQYEE